MTVSVPSTIPRGGRQEIVLIGPVCAGKSTVGDLLGEALGTEHVDVDHVAARYYVEAGWSVDRFRAVERRAGLPQAYRDGELAMVSVLERVLADHHNCVFSLGAAHTHFLTPALMDRAQQALISFAHVACYFRRQIPLGRFPFSASAALHSASPVGATQPAISSKGG